MLARSTARRGRSVLAIVVVAALVALGASGCRPEDKTKPILLVHGWSATGGTSCSGAFDGMIAKLRAQGFTGPFVRVGFYDGDTGCDVNLRSWGNFENGSSWKEVAKAFSKYVYSTYTVRNVAIDGVGYSMGGNIIRGAVYGAQKGESGFSAPIKVEDVVTLGAPFAGADWYSAGCLWGQCSTLKPGAADIDWLVANGNPQGVGGTEWTAIGSKKDAVTPEASATYINVPAARKVIYSDVPHTGSDNYMGRADVVARAGEALAKIDR